MADQATRAVGRGHAPSRIEDSAMAALLGGVFGKTAGRLLPGPCESLRA